MSEAIIRGRGEVILIKGDKLIRLSDAEALALAELVHEWRDHRFATKPSHPDE